VRAAWIPLVGALAGVCVIGLLGGDPRGARSIDAATFISLAGATLSAAVGLLAWRAGRRRARWLIAPSVLVALIGGLCGWIAGVEITGDVDRAARLVSPGRVAFLVAMTAFWMACLPALTMLVADGLTRLGTRRT
jgi:hypothetical protein